jgi:hypothetical protein
MMANINKQEIARLPIKQESNFTFEFSEDGWYIPTKKIWNKKEMDRVCFRVVEGERRNWFECGVKLAERIQETVDEALKTDGVDISKVERLDISIIRNGGEPKVFINIDRLPRLPEPKPSKWNRVWLSIRDMFGGKNGA